MTLMSHVKFLLYKIQGLPCNCQLKNPLKLTAIKTSGIVLMNGDVETVQMLPFNDPKSIRYKLPTEHLLYFISLKQSVKLPTISSQFTSLIPTEDPRIAPPLPQSEVVIK